MSANAMRRLARIFAILWCLGWIGLLIAMAVPVNDLTLAIDDKLAHTLGYLVMAASSALLASRLRHYVLLILLTGLLASAIEYAQRWLPWRNFDTGDLLANLIGVAVGAIVGVAFLLIRDLILRPWLKALPEGR